MKSRSLFAATVIASAALVLGACGSDKDTTATTAATTTVAPTTAAPTTAAPTTAAPTTAAPTTAARPTTTAPKNPTTTNGGGGMQAGAPSFQTFTVTSPVPCKDGNATATMKYTTLNVVSIAIKVGDKPFASTAGYGPNETAAVVSIPCTGAGSSTVQLKGCTENNTCAESTVAKVEITG